MSEKKSASVLSFSSKAAKIHVYHSRSSNQSALEVKIVCQRITYVRFGRQIEIHCRLFQTNCGTVI